MFVFPTGSAEYASLVLSVAAISAGLSSMLPARWGWKAFPLVGLALSVIAALLLVAAMFFANAAYKDRGYNMVITARTVLIIVAVAGVAFGLTLNARRRAG